MTLAEMRVALAPRIADNAAFDGWSNAAVDNAAASLGINPASARLAFPGGAMDMIDAWVSGVDASMAEHFSASPLAALPIRERIRRLVQFRLDAVAATRESLRRALAVMAMPQNLVRSAQLGWRRADMMWRLAGDVATDYNHYTKRAILGSIYAMTLAVYVGDESEGFADTAAFLDRRIDGIMRFEKAKAKMLNGTDEHFSPARFLGRLRYPSR
ncbi:MAG: COQ9 family protein [Novosphingobium sp.]